MGVDARMMIRYRGEKPTEQELARWSWDLCNVFGPNKFLMFANDSEYGTQRAVTLAGLYDEERTGLVWVQDGPDVSAVPGEYLLEVNLAGRYYGIGYERGDLLAYCAIAEWIEQNIPHASVWYGGDSSGVCVEPFCSDARAALKRHLFSKNGRDYFEHQKRGTYPTPPPCSLCIPGEPRFDRHGFGAYIGVNCGGCGKEFSSRDNGATWEVVEQPK